MTEPAAAEGVIVRDMLTISDAIDLFLARGFADRTRDTYRRTLNQFADRFPDRWDVAQISEDDVLRFLAAQHRHARGTKALTEAVLSSFFRFLYGSRKIRENPMGRVVRTRRVRPEDLDVVTVTSDDVRALLAAAESWPERLCVACLVYLGPRRRAAARLRLGDYDPARRKLRFREKGGRTIWKPVPHELAALIDAAITVGVYQFPDQYLIPPEGPLARDGDRDDRVIWRLVKKVAGRAGVHTTVHALRAAFAVFYLEQNPGHVESLQELLGHRSPNTTRVYLRKLDREAAMERVRGLSWAGNTGEPGFPQSAGKPLASSAGVGAGGFEPPFAENPHGERAGSEHAQDDLASALLDAARVANREEEHV